eukprot:4644393-Alexandrium_andersonii.AAC.1
MYTSALEPVKNSSPDSGPVCAVFPNGARHIIKAFTVGDLKAKDQPREPCGSSGGGVGKGKNLLWSGTDGQGAKLTIWRRKDRTDLHVIFKNKGAICQVRVDLFPSEDASLAFMKTLADQLVQGTIDETSVYDKRGAQLKTMGLMLESGKPGKRKGSEQTEAAPDKKAKLLKKPAASNKKPAANANSEPKAKSPATPTAKSEAPAKMGDTEAEDAKPIAQMTEATAAASSIDGEPLQDTYHTTPKQLG